MKTRPVRARVDGIDWATATADLDEAGVASLGPVLTVDECAALRDAFDDDARYRSTIDMTRYRFGSGTYRYYAYPHPEPLDALRRSLWPHLLPIARELGGPARSSRIVAGRVRRVDRPVSRARAVAADAVDPPLRPR